MMHNADKLRLANPLPRVEALAEAGLTQEQALERLEKGYANTKPVSAEKTILQILQTNILTYFNLVFAIFAICIIAVGEYNHLMFMVIIIANTIIGIVQEIRSKRALAKLTFLSAPQATVIRDGERKSVPAEEAVLDDVAVFAAGNQVFADAIVVSGECQANEALVTGEADEISKTPGDSLLSGSFIVSGECRARLDKVGRDSFISQLTMEAKKTNIKRSGMVSILQRLVQVIGIIMVPVGAALFIQQFRLPEIMLNDAVTSTVAALVGMIPEGLYLLVSVALTVSVLRLARKRTLVHEMKCVESLARVDVLCVDKTGTITENRMDVKKIVPMCADGYSEGDITRIMTDYVGSMTADNETMAALQAFFPDGPAREARRIMPFSSATKYSGAAFGKGESYLLGAPERILLADYDRYKAEIEKHSAMGYRVLLLAHYAGDLTPSGEEPASENNGAAPPPAANSPQPADRSNPKAAIDIKQVTPLSLILISSRVRAEAPGTFSFFASQGVKIIVISGDNPVTVSQIALEAGIEGAERYVDAAELATDRDIESGVAEYVVFGRVTPEQKRKLVRALKAKGHTVAMTGDGVNDVLALKDADCSIAMASGSEVASQVADIVLLDSDFSAMPAVVMEGRRVINNIERSAALFLVRNIFSFLLAIVAISLARQYPFSPAQLSLFGGMLIGIPSFILALEPNKNLVRGKFFTNVLKSALPAGLTDFAALTVLLLIAPGLGIPNEQMSTMASIIIAFVGFLMLYRLCRPLNAIRAGLIVCMLLGFSLGGLLFGGLFSMVPLSAQNIWITVAFCAAAAPMVLLLSMVFVRGAKNKH